MAMTVFGTGWDLRDPFNTYIFTSMRQIVDLSDLGASLMIHSTGQSGHPAHRHYDDFIEPWRNLEYHSNRWTREEVERDSKERLMLIPEAGSTL